VHGLAAALHLHAADASVAEVNADVIRRVAAGTMGGVSEAQEMVGDERLRGVASHDVVARGLRGLLGIASAEQRELHVTHGQRFPVLVSHGERGVVGVLECDH